MSKHSFQWIISRASYHARRVGLVLCASLLLAAVVVRPAWALLDQEVAVAVAYRDSPTDPWGKAWRKSQFGWSYSTGPNGKDEGGMGDDLVVRHAQHGWWGRVRVWWWSSWVLVSMAAALAAALIALEAGSAPRSPRASVELRHFVFLCAGLGLLMGVVPAVFLALCEGAGPAWLSMVTPMLFVPLPVGIAATGSALALIVASLVRLRASERTA